MAVVTTNLPMLSPIIQSALRAISSEKILSWLAMSSWSRRKGSGKHSTGEVLAAESRSVQLNTVISSKQQRGKAPKSKPMYNITAFSESEERIMGMTGQVMQQEMIRERDETAAMYEGSGRTSPRGGIQQQVEVTVTREASTLSAAELERRQMLGYMSQISEDVGTSATCQSAVSQRP